MLCVIECMSKCCVDGWLLCVWWNCEWMDEVVDYCFVGICVGVCEDVVCVDCVVL